MKHSATHGNEAVYGDGSKPPSVCLQCHVNGRGSRGVVNGACGVTPVQTLSSLSCPPLTCGVVAFNSAYFKAIHEDGSKLPFVCLKCLLGVRAMELVALAGSV